MPAAAVSMMHRSGLRARARRLGVFALLATGCAPPQTHVPAAPQQQGIPVFSDEAANDAVHLHAGKTTLPLVLVKGYPFLKGEINGVKGKLLFDLGEDASFVLDARRIEPPGGWMAGQGYFASGQTFATYRFPLVNELKLAHGPSFHAIPNVRGVPALPIEAHVTPDFLGWIGLHFFRGYILKLDYQKPNLSFYRDDGKGAGMRAAMKGETPLQVIHFTGREQGGLRMFPVRIGSVLFQATCDSGSHDTAWLAPGVVEKLEAEGAVLQKPDGTYTVAGISIDGHRVPLQSRVEIGRGRAPFGSLATPPGQNTLVLGYEFLSRYTTVWDFAGATLTLAGKQGSATESVTER